MNEHFSKGIYLNISECNKAISKCTDGIVNLSTHLHYLIEFTDYINRVGLTKVRTDYPNVNFIVNTNWSSDYCEPKKKIKV